VTIDGAVIVEICISFPPLLDLEFATHTLPLTVNGAAETKLIVGTQFIEKLMIIIER
jgi:hypothetical protein